MSKKQVQPPLNHLSITALQLELRDGTILCVNERSVQAIGAGANMLRPHTVASTIRQVLNSAFRLRQLDEPYPAEPSEVTEGNLRRMLVMLSDKRAAPDRCTIVRLLSRDGCSVSRIATSSEAVSNRDLHPRHLRSIYLYCYNNDLERIRRGIDALVMPVLTSAKTWSDPG